MLNKLFTFLVLGVAAILIAPFVWALLVTIVGFFISILQGLMQVGFVCGIGAVVYYGSIWIDQNL